MLPGSFPFIPTASNANINGNILTDRVPGAWSSFPALNRPPQPVQLPTSTLISALISYINYLRQNLDSVANANNCSNLNPLDMSTYNTINQPTLINSGNAANQMLTSAPSWPWTSIQSKPVSNNNATTQNWIAFWQPIQYIALFEEFLEFLMARNRNLPLPERVLSPRWQGSEVGLSCTEDAFRSTRPNQPNSQTEPCQW